MSNLLNIVDENDEIIGQETRANIHERGLRHREVYVYFITPQHEMIVQRRAKNKDVFPGLLDAAVGGHVEIGQSYEETALREIEEETGIKISQADLMIIEKIKNHLLDEVTGKINRAFQTEYLYLYKGKIADLQVEAGEASGFEIYPLSRLKNLDEKERAKFTPHTINLIERTDWLNLLKNYPV